MSKADQLRALREARAKNSRGTRESRPRGVTTPKVGAGAARRPDVEARDVRRFESAHDAAGVAPGPREAKRGRGRPKVEGKRPWEVEGVSRRTWYRRQKEKR